MVYVALWKLITESFNPISKPSRRKAEQRGDELT